MCNVTVVCCWTNEKMYNEFLATLKAQDAPCKIIGIDNRGNNAFTSCAAAYNSVIGEIDTEYVIYSHQDILLNSPGVLSKFLSYLANIGRDDILGIAGVKFELSSHIFTDIMQTHPYDGSLIPAGRYHVEGGIMECDTVDECFFGGHASHFRDYPFDAETCDNWHLYAAEACMRAKTKAHAKIWVCGADIIHRSIGNVNSSFVFGFCRLCRKYAGDFPFIRTTCACSFTDERSLRKYIMKHFLFVAPKKALMRQMSRMNIYFFMRKIYRFFTGRK